MTTGGNVHPGRDRCTVAPSIAITIRSSPSNAPGRRTAWPMTKAGTGPRRRARGLAKMDRGIRAGNAHVRRGQFSVSEPIGTTMHS